MIKLNSKKDEILKYFNSTYERYVFKYGNDNKILSKIEHIKLNIDQIYDGIILNNKVCSIPTQSIIKSPNGKERKIVYHKLEERFLMSMVYRYLTDKHKDRISQNCFSYQENVSVIDAVEKINISDRKNCFGLKLDISKYFDSVPKDILLNILNDLLKDEDKDLSDFILNTYTLDKICVNGKIENKYLSLMQGCAIGSVLANIILKPLDNILMVKCNNLYARYSDDLILFCNSEELREEIVEIIISELNKLGLTVNPKKVEYFNPFDDITFLGLKILSDGNIDLSEESFIKKKRQIKRLFKKYRYNITKYKRDPYKEAKKMIKEFNKINYSPYITDPKKFGWCYYMFRYITVTDTLRELDFYYKDTIRYLIVGKHRKSNYNKISTEELRTLGYISFVEMYLNMKYDTDYYYHIIYNI